MVKNIVSGDTLSFDYPVTGDHTPTTGYSFWLALRNPDDAIDIKIGVAGVTITTTGDIYEVTVSSSVTAGYTAGEYSYTVYVYDSDERYQVERGTLTVLPDIAAAAAGFDGRSRYQKTLDAIEAVLEGRASKDQESYSIAGRQLSRTPIPDLLALRTQYTALVNQEEALIAQENGRGTKQRILAVLP